LTVTSSKVTTGNFTGSDSSETDIAPKPTKNIMNSSIENEVRDESNSDVSTVHSEEAQQRTSVIDIWRQRERESLQNRNTVLPITPRRPTKAVSNKSVVEQNSPASNTSEKKHLVPHLIENEASTAKSSIYTDGSTPSRDSTIMANFAFRAGAASFDNGVIAYDLNMLSSPIRPSGNSSSLRKDTTASSEILVRRNNGESVHLESPQSTSSKELGATHDETVQHRKVPPSPRTVKRQDDLKRRVGIMDIWVQREKEAAVSICAITKSPSSVADGIYDVQIRENNPSTLGSPGRDHKSQEKLAAEANEEPRQCIESPARIKLSVVDRWKKGMVHTDDFSSSQESSPTSAIRRNKAQCHDRKVNAGYCAKSANQRVIENSLPGNHLEGEIGEIPFDEEFSSFTPSLSKTSPIINHTVIEGSSLPKKNLDQEFLSVCSKTSPAQQDGHGKAVESTETKEPILSTQKIPWIHRVHQNEKQMGTSGEKTVSNASAKSPPYTQTDATSLTGSIDTQVHKDLVQDFCRNLLVSRKTTVVQQKKEAPANVWTENVRPVNPMDSNDISQVQVDSMRLDLHQGSILSSKSDIAMPEEEKSYKSHSAIPPRNALLDQFGAKVTETAQPKNNVLEKSSQPPGKQHTISALERSRQISRGIASSGLLGLSEVQKTQQQRSSVPDNNGFGLEQGYPNSPRPSSVNDALPSKSKDSKLQHNAIQTVTSQQSFFIKKAKLETQRRLDGRRNSFSESTFCPYVGETMKEDTINLGRSSTSSVGHSSTIEEQVAKSTATGKRFETNTPIKLQASPKQNSRGPSEAGQSDSLSFFSHAGSSFSSIVSPLNFIPIPANKRAVVKERPETSQVEVCAEKRLETTMRSVTAREHIVTKSLQQEPELDLIPTGKSSIPEDEASYLQSCATSQILSNSTSFYREESRRLSGRYHTTTRFLEGGDAQESRSCIGDHSSVSSVPDSSRASSCSSASSHYISSFDTGVSGSLVETAVEDGSYKRHQRRNRWRRGAPKAGRNFQNELSTALRNAFNSEGLLKLKENVSETVKALELGQLKTGLADGVHVATESLCTFVDHSNAAKQKLSSKSLSRFQCMPVRPPSEEAKDSDVSPWEGIAIEVEYVSDSEDDNDNNAEESNSQAELFCSVNTGGDSEPPASVTQDDESGADSEALASTMQEGSGAMPKHDVISYSTWGESQEGASLVLDGQIEINSMRSQSYHDLE